MEEKRIKFAPPLNTLQQRDL